MKIGRQHNPTRDAIVGTMMRPNNISEIQPNGSSTRLKNEAEYLGMSSVIFPLTGLNFTIRFLGNCQVRMLLPVSGHAISAQAEDVIFTDGAGQTQAVQIS